jgi:hypothetical protein
VKSARAWKELYAAERASLGARGLDELVANAVDVELAPMGALVFPHTFLASAGELVAAAARAVVRSGAEEVLAIGVLHGGRGAGEVAERARSGDAAAHEEMRRVHLEAGQAADEYSLDGFAALVARAAQTEGKKAPRVHARFPFLVGDDPASLPGIEELVLLRDRGCAIVATADPIHHGAVYGTPEGERRARGDATTLEWARATITRQHALLSAGDYATFQREAAACRCDFRDAGPVLAWLLAARGAFTLVLRELVLVDYAATLHAEQPTWVAGALSAASQARP